MRTRLSALVIILVSIALSLGAEGPHHVLDDEKNLSLLFVVSGSSGSIADDALTLDVVPSVVYFSDRPHRVAGHMTVSGFLKRWSSGPDPFAVDPPNAVLSVLGEDGASDTVVELTSIEMKADAIRFGFEVLEGEPPDGAFGPASLFIDCVGLVIPCHTN